MARTDRRRHTSPQGDVEPPRRPAREAQIVPPASVRAGPPHLLTPTITGVRLLSVLLVAATFVAFAPVLSAEFTNWDDPQTIAQNPRLNPPSVSGVLYFWDPGHPYMDLYVPVTYTVWSAVAAVAYAPGAAPGEPALNPWVFHGLNLLLHAASALVAFALLRRLVRTRRPLGPGRSSSRSTPCRSSPSAGPRGRRTCCGGCSRSSHSGSTSATHRRKGERRHERPAGRIPPPTPGRTKRVRAAPDFTTRSRRRPWCSPCSPSLRPSSCRSRPRRSTYFCSAGRCGRSA